MIAMALSCNPTLLIADEPTTALDVTTQTQILELMRQLQQEDGMAIMLITHDLGVIAEMATDVAVMYLGRVVEQAPVDEIFHAPGIRTRGRSCAPSLACDRARESASRRSWAPCRTRTTGPRGAPSIRAARTSCPAPVTARRRACGRSGTSTP